MAMTGDLSSKTILQKLSTVLGVGPCVRMTSLMWLSESGLEMHDAFDMQSLADVVRLTRVFSTGIYVALDIGPAI